MPQFVIALVFKSILKVTRFVKIQTFRQLPNSRKRLRNVCHSIAEKIIILFLRLVLQQWA